MAREHAKMNIEELQKCAVDPVYFIETYVKIPHPIHGPILFKLHPFQREYVNEMYAGSVVAAFGRQMGKTMLVAAYLLWDAIFKYDQRSLIVSKTLPMASEVLSRIKFMLEELPGWMKPSVRYMNKQCIELDNGSMIKIGAANGHAARGLSLNNLVFEEFAFWSLAQQEDVLASMIPCLYGHNGKLIVASTLATTLSGTENKFNVMYENARTGRTKMKALRYSWQDHPERDEAWANQMMRMLGKERFKSEYEVNLEAV